MIADYNVLLKDVESQPGLAECTTAVDIDEEGAVKKRGNNNYFFHGVFDNRQRSGSFLTPSILPILRVTKQKEEEYGIFVIIAATFVQFYCFFPLFVQFYPCFYSSSFFEFHSIPFLFFFLLQERKGNMIESIVIIIGEDAP
jgi:hypothetical protein